MNKEIKVGIKEEEIKIDNREGKNSGREKYTRANKL